MHLAAIRKDKPVILGYSDGPDSRYLLEQLLNAIPATQIRLIYCHHGLRSAADKEAENTRELARKKGLQCIIKHIPIKTYQKRWGVSEEMAGHFLRKSIFIHYAKRHNAQVCTGHHANDAAENQILKRERGIKDGVTGLHYKYIQYDVEFIKPLLDTTKTEILNYLNTHNIAYSTDESNVNLNIKRNIIRNALTDTIASPHNTPALSLEHFYNLVKQTMHCKADYCLIEKKDFQNMSDIEISLISRLIPQCFQEYINQSKKVIPPYWNINRDHVTALLKALMGKAGGKYSLPENHSLEWNGKWLGIYNNSKQEPFLSASSNNKSLKKEKVLTFLRQRQVRI